MDIRPFEDIEALPRWAAVAFATRCARRVLPLLKRDWDIPRDLVQILRFELRHAETAAGLARDLPVPDEILATCRRVLDAASKAERSGSRIGPEVARTIEQAFDSALDPSERGRTWPRKPRGYGPTTRPWQFMDVMTGTSPRDPRPPHVVSTEQAAIHAQKAARYLEVQGKLSGIDDFVVTAMRADLELLQDAARQKAWTHDTPVPGVFFPPLFPKPYPAWLCDKSTEVGQDEKVLFEEASRLSDVAWSKNAQRADTEEIIVSFERSAASFKVLVDRFRERPSYLYNCGASLLELADVDQTDVDGANLRVENREQRALAAIQWIARAIEVSDFAPEHCVRPAPASFLSKYHHNLGQAVRHLGRQDEPASLAWRLLALTEYERALALDPDNKEARACIDGKIGGKNVGILYRLPNPLPPLPYELMIKGPPWSA